MDGAFGYASLVSDKSGISQLGDEHPEDAVHQRKVEVNNYGKMVSRAELRELPCQHSLGRREDLSKRYSSFRRTLGDGNCFYRALSFAYLEALLGNSKGVQKLRKILTRNKGELLSMGFKESTFEHAFNMFMDVIDLVEADVSGGKLLAVFNDRNTSDCLVLFLRLMTSAYLQKKSEFFEYFLDAGMSIKDFCTQEVEPMAMESDHIHLTALTQALNVPIQVEYMDKSNTAVNHHIFPEGSKPLVHLLYKPGHYDILYKANKSK